MRESEPAPLILVYFRQHLQNDFYDRHLLIFYSTDDTQVVIRSQNGSTNTQSHHMEETPTGSSEKSQYHKRTLSSKINGTIVALTMRMSQCRQLLGSLKDTESEYDVDSKMVRLTWAIG